MRRIFLIPHGSDPNLKVRGLELSRALAGQPNQEVYCLEFDRNFSTNKLDIIRFIWRNIFRRTSYRKEGELTVVTFPYLFLPLSNMTLPLVRWYATHMVRRIIANLQPTHVINESHFCVSIRPSKQYHLIYDLVDDHLPGSLEGWFGQIVSAFTMQQLAVANEIWTISHTLIQKLSLLGYSHVQYVPNGTVLQPFHTFDQSRVHTLRASLTQEHSFLIGYIGNHASWSGIDLVLEIAKKAPIDWKFVVVGGGTEVERLRKNPPDNVLFTGPIPREEIVEYFSAIDVGILPFIKNDLTDAALQLKIIEYGAARKITIAQSLSELEILKLPHVQFAAERTVASWIELLSRARGQRWDAQWDDCIESYDWNNIALRISWA